MRSATKVIAATAAVLTLAACSSDAGGSSTGDSDAVVVGAGASDQSELLAYIYAGAVRSAGLGAEVRTNVGDRDTYVQMLDSGDVSLIPDFTGELLATFDSLSGATEADDVFNDLNRSLPEGLSVSDYALAENRTAIAVASDGPSSAVKSMTDFEPNCARTVVGVVDDSSEPTPVDVAARVSSGYDCTFGDFSVYPDAQSAVDGLAAGAVGALAIGTASFGPLAKDLVTLEDDKEVFTAQNVVPLFRNGTFDDLQIRSLNVVAGELTTADLADMIGEVRSGQSSADVAGKWLGEHTL